FSTDASGFIGDGISSGFMSVTGGRLVTTAQPTTGQQGGHNLVGTPNNSTAQQAGYHAENTTPSTDRRWLIFAAENNAAYTGVAGNPFRRMGVWFGGNSVYAHHYDAANPVGVNTLIGTALDNTTYNVDIVVDNTGATLYVYQAGQDRAS